MATTIITTSSSSKGAKTVTVAAMSAQMVGFPVEGSYQKFPS
jgi:hypothetical protein